MTAAQIARLALDLLRQRIDDGATARPREALASFDLIRESTTG